MTYAGIYIYIYIYIYVINRKYNTNKLVSGKHEMEKIVCASLRPNLSLNHMLYNSC